MIMKYGACLSAFALLAHASLCAAQPAANSGTFATNPQRPGAPGFAGQRFGGLGVSPALGRALDKNQDGELSADEIRDAAAALSALDQNHDGKITRDELRIGGAAGFGMPANRAGSANAGARPLANAGAHASAGSAEHAGGSAAREARPQAFADRLMKNDTNQDGKLSADELPKSMPHLIERADANGDGAVDRSELEQLNTKARSQ